MFSNKIVSHYKIISTDQQSLRYNVYDSEHRSKKIGSFDLSVKDFLDLNDLVGRDVKKADSKLTDILRKNNILKKGYLNGSGDGDTMYSWLVGVSGETAEGYRYIFIEVDDKDEKLYQGLNEKV